MKKITITKSEMVNMVLEAIDKKTTDIITIKGIAFATRNISADIDSKQNITFLNIYDSHYKFITSILMDEFFEISIDLWNTVYCMK